VVPSTGIGSGHRTAHTTQAERIADWPLQDIVLFRSFCARINHSFIAHSHLHCPHYCNAIARLLRNIQRPPDPPFVCHAQKHIGNGNIV